MVGAKDVICRFFFVPQVDARSRAGRRRSAVEARNGEEVLALGLKEAKDMVDGAPKVIKEGMKKAEAEELKKRIEAAGGKVTLK